MPQNSFSRRHFRPFRFALPTLLVLVVIALLWLGLTVSAVRQQQATVAELSKLHVVVHYDHHCAALPPLQLAARGSTWGPLAFPNQRATSPNAPSWLRHLVGDDYFQTATAVTISRDDLPYIRAALPHLKELSRLKEIFLIAPTCGNALPSYTRARQLLQRELPNVKVTGFVIPIVG